MSENGKHKTNYLVLAQQDGMWGVLGEAESTSPRGAITQVLSRVSESEVTGTYVAVPARSWKPVSVAPKTTLTFG